MNNDLSTIDQNSYLTKDNFEHYYRIANMMSKSQMVPKNYIDKPQDVLIAMEYGRALNLGPLQAIQNIAVINGRPSLYGDCVLAVCSGHSDFEDILEEPILDNKTIVGFSCTVKRKNRSPVTHTFTIKDATEAQLWGKAGPWKQYPARMLQMRARAFALRDSFADALGGVRIAEEVQDYRETKDITPKSSIIAAKEEIKSILAKNSQKEDILIDEDSKILQVDPETGEVLPEHLQ